MQGGRSEQLRKTLEADRSHPKVSRQIAEESASNDMRAKPYDRSRLKQDVSGVQLDIQGFAFTTHKKCLVVCGLFFVNARSRIEPRYLGWVIRHYMNGSAPEISYKSPSVYAS